MGWQDKAEEADDGWQSKAIDVDAPYVPPNIYGGLSGVKEMAYGLGEAALTMGTGAVTAIASGAYAAARLVVGEGLVTKDGRTRITGSSAADVAEDMAAFNDAYTFQPKTGAGQFVLETIAGPIMYIDDTADAIATKLGGGNPIAETIIKTTLLGAFELAPGLKGIKNANAAVRHMKRSKAMIADTADRLGIDVNIRELKESVIDAANRMTPDEKGANTPLLQEAMREAEAKAYAAKNAAYEVAKNKDVWVDTRSINDLAAETRMRLGESYDLSVMPKLNKRLTEMGLELPQGSKVKFWELEKIRRRINTDISGLKRSTTDGAASEASALKVLKKDLDRFIDNEFNKTALEAGQMGPPQQQFITGEREGVAAWKNARELNAQWKQDFHTDRVISDLIKQDATPEVMTDWILGANAMGAKQQSVAVVARLKQVLGENHPAIEGIRQDFLFRVAEPLLQETPNFNQFIRNYDKMIKKNHSLVSELGLSEHNFTELVTFAREAKKLPVNERNFQLQDLTRGLAVFWQGHSMAKRSLRVGYARNVLNGLFNMDRVAQRTLLYDMAGIRYGYPAMPRSGPLAAQFIAGASLNELMMDQDEGR